MDSTTKTADGGGGYGRIARYRNVSELMTRFRLLDDKHGTRKSWVNVVAQYERLPYRDESNALKSNFGQLRYKVDLALNTYVDFATEREQWARISSDFGPPAHQKVNSEHITRAFQKFCIVPWKRKFHDVMMSAKDMLMFSRGILHWDKDYGCYPCSIPISDVMPDDEAGQFPEDFDVMFIRRRYTAVELYMKVEDEEIAEAHGWNREAVLKVLRQGNVAWKDRSLTDVLNEMATGNVTSDYQDFTIDVIQAYVREYKEDGEYGNRISKFVFAASGHYPKKSDGMKETEDYDSTGFLLEKRNCHKCMSEVVATVCHTVSRKFYDEGSFAQLIYTTSKQYDILMNRILQAVEDNMRVFLRGGNPERIRKMLSSAIGSFNVMDPETHIEQERLTRPIGDAANVLRQVMIDQNAGIGTYQVGQTDQSGVTKTAKQAEIDLAESSRISSGHLKVFNLFWSYIMCEMYRRWVTMVDDTCKEHAKYKKFVKYLKDHDVPEAAWKPENVNVESVLSLGAGSPAVKLQNARVILEALATPARTPGEQQAKRDMISAAVGIDNADAYLPVDGGIKVMEDSLIGLENESLVEPLVDPSNVPVSPDHMHMRHIPSHISEMGRFMGITESLFQGLDQFHPDDKGIMLKMLQDNLIGIDHLGAHALAHIQIAGESGSKVVKAEIRQYALAIQEINKRQDKLEQIVGEIQQGRMAEASEKNAANPEFDHKQKMYQLDEEHQANILALDYRKNVMKAEQLRDQSAANSQHKETLETQKTIAKVQRETMIDQVKLRKEKQKNGSKPTT